MKLNFLNNQNDPVYEHDCCHRVPYLGDDFYLIESFNIIVMDQEYP